ncbi:hypothetical protein FYJ88_10495 [Corynebacterium urealyticum]|uniref:hypothetical protein n=1 Tax=Corynebacterium urealyticum TaxID=43771 RepID=UPI0011E7CD4B|nr:hypothetical protein [Corynebacterium urealyticum]TYR16876.1 hypothetical protein FYJ88_10495 [Corynebacterium urealyticum]
MKRFPRTLTAAVMAGALAVGGATVAQAQDNTAAQAETQTQERTNWPESFTADDGTEWFKGEGNEYSTKPAFEGAEPATADAEQADAMLTAAGIAKTVEDPETPENPEVDESDIPDPATKEDSEGNTWYLHNNGEIYVKDRNDWNAEVTDELRDAYYEAFPDAKPDAPENPGSSDSDKKKLAWLALPAALIIGGIVWHLMKDGKTYTPDESRKNQDPTAEEKAASDKMLAENKDEVIAQGGQLAEGAEGADAAATDRGIAAETGSNAAARGLAALAVVAMVAAGAFAASRKLFA